MRSYQVSYGLIGDERVVPEDLADREKMNNQIFARTSGISKMVLSILLQYRTT